MVANGRRWPARSLAQIHAYRVHECLAAPEAMGQNSIAGRAVQCRSFRADDDAPRASSVRDTDTKTAPAGAVGTRRGMGSDGAATGDETDCDEAGQQQCVGPGLGD